MSQKLQFTSELEPSVNVKPEPLNPRAKLTKTERRLFLAQSHDLYARNQHVKHEGVWLHFEPPVYHRGMAQLYRS